MVKYSIISCGFNDNPTRECVIAHKETLRMIMDTDTGIGYCLIPMGFDFSTPFKGEHGYNIEEIKDILKESRWAHNAGVE